MPTSIADLFTACAPKYTILLCFLLYTKECIDHTAAGYPGRKPKNIKLPIHTTVT